MAPVLQKRFQSSRNPSGGIADLNERYTEISAIEKCLGKEAESKKPPPTGEHFIKNE